jgi:voltage-gated potassium channel Kch
VQLFSERRVERMYKAVQNGRIIPYMAFVMLSITLIAALAVRLFAHGEFTSYGESVWWAAQTVTTVGYGDVIPQTGLSKVIAVIVMLLGISTVSLTTAVITSVVISTMQRRHPAVDPYGEALEDIAKRLEILERLEQQMSGLSGPSPAPPTRGPSAA